MPATLMDRWGWTNSSYGKGSRARNSGLVEGWSGQVVGIDLVSALILRKPNWFAFDLAKAVTV